MRRFRWMLALLLLGEQRGFPQDVAQSDFKKLSLEELMEVDVTSVSRKTESLGQTAAAITVITSEDIRRTGVTSIPEALRLVPGLEVARFNASSWAISSRGFNSLAANKLLVLIDGRTAYSPLFSGTFWEVQDLVLDDIARIEVVRGPGATLWGANAVNGVINIITKTAHQTKNTAVTLSGLGADDLALGSFRTGQAITPNTSYRVFGKYVYRDQMVLANGDDAKDSLRIGRTGFRIDSVQGSNDFSFQGDFYRGFAGLLNREDAKVLGGTIVGRWDRELANDSQFQLQVYYDRGLRRTPLQSDFRQRILDIDGQYSFTIDRHNLTVGAGYRWNADNTIRTPVLSFLPADRSYPVQAAFVQDEILVAKDRVKLQIGTKLEHNAFSGLEVQPSVRALWTVRSDHVLWGAVTRAVRAPTRFDSDIRFGPPGLQFVGNPDFNSEVEVAIESGYRSRPTPQVSLEIATYYSFYDQLRSLELRPIGGILILNNMNARTYGGEIALTYDATEWLRFNTAYSYLGKRLSLDPGHVDLFNGTIEGNDPTNQFRIRGSADLPHEFEWDATLRFVGQLPAPVVPRYLELDQRLGWNATPQVEFSIIGRNLLHRRHPEFGPDSPTRQEVERNIYGRIAIRF